MQLAGTNSTWPRLAGICVGLLASMIVLAATGGRRESPRQTGAMFSECDGAIRAIVIHYIRGAQFVTPIYRQFLAALPPQVRVYVVCPDQAALQELKSELGDAGARLVPVLCAHDMTVWSRDRWVALSPAWHGGPVTLVAPASEAGADLWPQRRGDQQVADDLAISLAPADAFMRSGLFFDGGDLLADSRSVFVTPSAIRANLQRTVADEAALRQSLQDLLNRQPVLLTNAPDHHAGMFMMAAGEDRVVVGDPRVAKPLFVPTDLPGGADFSAATQYRFDSVAAAAIAAGYHVTRIPCVPAGDGKTYLTFVNGIIDQRDGRRTIYLPQYKGQDRLNNSAMTVWLNLGYRVVPIDVTSAFRYFGTLHCLVNVLDRG